MNSIYRHWLPMLVVLLVAACGRHAAETHSHDDHHEHHDHHHHAPSPGAVGQLLTPTAGALTAVDAHMPAIIPGQTRGVVYLALANGTDQEREILHLHTPIAGTAEVHRHTYEDGMMRMRQVRHPRIPAGGTLAFEPGGYHIMLIDVAEEPPVGSQIPLDIEFNGGEKLTVSVEVRAR